MKYKISARLTVIFFIAYSLASTFGSIFLVTWGSTNRYKEVMMFMLTWPLDWAKLVVDSIVWLPVNILFWTTITYLTTLAIERFTKFIQRDDYYENNVNSGNT